MAHGPVISPEKRITYATLRTLGFGKLEAGRIAGISRGTVTRWEKDPEYQEQVSTIRRIVAEEVGKRLSEVVANMQAILYSAAAEFLPKLAESVKHLDPEKLGPHQRVSLFIRFLSLPGIRYREPKAEAPGQNITADMLEQAAAQVQTPPHRRCEDEAEEGEGEI